MDSYIKFIKDNASHNELTNFNTERTKRVVTLPERNYEWLIKQAERVEELEDAIEYINTAKLSHYNGIENMLEDFKAVIRKSV